MARPGVPEHVRLLKAFLEKPSRTGAIAPSSVWLAARMVEDMGLADATAVAELGGGTGALTRAIVEEISPKALFLVLEVHAGLAAYLHDEFPTAKVVNDSGEHLIRHLEAHGRSSADAVLSGLPWATFSPDLQWKIVDAVVQGLRPGGRFSTFAYVHAKWLPAARRFRRMLDDRFRTVHTTPVVWRNLPPALVYRCER